MATFSITKRIDSVTRIPPKYMGEKLPAPKAVKIELTSQCNYRCGFCAHRLRLKDRGEMDPHLYERLVDEMAEAGVEELGMFYIGESFMCDWLPEAIARAKKAGISYIFLTTNGSLSTPEKVRACMEAGLDSLKFSINFYSEGQLHDVARVSGVYWRRAIENLKRARALRDAHGYRCGLYASSIRFDGAQGELMDRVVEEIRPFVDEHYWLPLYGMNGASKAAGWQPQPGNPGRIDALRAPLPCWAVFTEGHITADGVLSACCFGNGADDALAMADLKAVSFMEGWNSPAYQRLRTAHLAKDVSATACAECAAG
jgi:hypothetical protein